MLKFEKMTYNIIRGVTGVKVTPTQEKFAKKLLQPYLLGGAIKGATRGKNRIIAVNTRKPKATISFVSFLKFCYYSNYSKNGAELVLDYSTKKGFLIVRNKQFKKLDELKIINTELNILLDNFDMR